MNENILLVSGLWDSGPQHWQTQWQQQHPLWSKVAHRDFAAPVRDEWVAELNAAIAACDGPPVLLAHSLGCMLVAHWAASGSALKVAGAMLVAPSDVAAPSYPIDANGFLPIPMTALPFPSLVVYSTNDEYATVERSQAFAQAWGSELVDIGDAGHINGDSGHGPWPEGYALLEKFCLRL
ncbi:MAG: alpha/beta hydrolase [Pseudomonadota bacterium]|nr:alpha/beta hydrolase [Pseudomonadota bacterium]